VTVKVSHTEMKRRRAAALAESWQERLIVAEPKPGWEDWAACRGLPVRWFYGQQNDGGRARAICAQCPVRLSCLGAARHTEEHERWTNRVYGVRGGLTVAQRVNVYRRMAREVAA
jgi:transcription factor WhiB